MQTPALSVRQPYASLIVHGHKSIENRVWSTEYRGPLVIHAARHRPDPLLVELAAGLTGIEEFPRGELIGYVSLMGTLTDVTRPEWARWWRPGMIAWVLAGAHPYHKPLPYRGRRGLFDVVLPRAYRPKGVI